MVHVIGEILVDIFKSESSEEVFPGGAPFNVASNIKHFGGDVSFYGAVGKDEYGKFLSKFARSRKFNNLLIKKCNTRYTTQAIVSLNNGERSFKFVRENGADYALSIKNLEKLDIKENDIVHIGSLMLSFPRGRKFFTKAVEFAKSKGALISFDVNYRDDIFISALSAKNICKKAMKVADIIKISDEELNILDKAKKIETQIKNLGLENKIVFISKGKDGSTMKNSKNQFISVCTKPIKPVDTTGAGDAFYSYILYELDKDISKINNIELVMKMLQKANAVGAIATQKKGAINVVPSIEELDKYLGD